MARSIYWRAVSYSYVINKGGPYYMDDLQAAFVHYFNKTGKNLFDQHDGCVLQCIKWMSRWRYSNATHNKSFVEFDTYHRPNHKTPLDELEEREAVERIYDRIRRYHSGYELRSIDPNQLIQFTKYLEQGYTVEETRGFMGLTVGQAYNYKKKIKSILRQMTNPFSGNKAPISKKILRKTFDSNPEKYEDYVYDTDRDCDSNEYYELRVHKDKPEWILIKEPEMKFEI